MAHPQSWPFPNDPNPEPAELAEEAETEGRGEVGVSPARLPKSRPSPHKAPFTVVPHPRGCGRCEEVKVPSAGGSQASADAVVDNERPVASLGPYHQEAQGLPSNPALLPSHPGIPLPGQAKSRQESVLSTLCLQGL